MKPSKEAMDKMPWLSDWFGPMNLETVVEDFDLVKWPDDSISQQLVDFAFSSFTLGMANVINPKSNFNTKYRIGEPVTGEPIDEAKFGWMEPKKSEH